jgi:hypothetical protein
MEPHVQSSLSSEDKINTEETKVMFGLEEIRIRQLFLISQDLQMVSNDQLPLDTNAKSLSFSILILFIRDIFKLF